MDIQKTLKHTVGLAGIAILGFMISLALAQTAEASHHGPHGRHHHHHHRDHTFISFGYHDPFYASPGLAYWHNRWHYTLPAPTSYGYGPRVRVTVPAVSSVGITAKMQPSQGEVQSSTYVPHMRHLATLSVEKRAALEKELAEQQVVAGKAEK